MPNINWFAIGMKNMNFCKGSDQIKADQKIFQLKSEFWVPSGYQRSISSSCKLKPVMLTVGGRGISGTFNIAIWSFLKCFLVSSHVPKGEP